MDKNESPKPIAKYALIVILIAAACFYTFFILRTSFKIKGETFFTLLDDAMVSMRYAKHLAQGYGLVWNIGEKPIEGFTNPGWTLFMAFLHLFPISASKISLVVMIVSTIILLANTLVVYKICNLLRPDSKYAPLLAATTTAFYFPLVFWTLRGMETGMQVLLIDLALLLVIQTSRDQGWRFPILISLIFCLAILVRMDAILQVSILAIYLAVKTRFDVRVVTLPFLMIVITTLAVFWFQHAYFGDFLPNTYYQKVTGFSIWERVRNGILVFLQHAARDTLFLSAVSFLGFILYKDLRNREFLLLAGLFAAQCAYSIFVGGDYAEVEVDAANRFITQGMSALIILSSLVADRAVTRLLLLRRPPIPPRPWVQSVVAVGMGFAVLFVISGAPWINWRTDNAPFLKADIRRVKLGLLISKYTSPEVTIAVHAAGQIPYYSERRTIDLLGLNDAVVAKGPPASPFYPGHDKWNYNYSILQLKPDLIADNFKPLAGFMKDVQEYQKLDNGIYIRKDSTLLDVEGLSQEYR